MPSMGPPFRAVQKDLFLVPLDLDLAGFRNFISAWVYTDPRLSFVVDPGPRATIPMLMEALSGIGVARLDYILLTHIHLDHAGGTGMLLGRYPEAMVVCHPAAVRHLSDPGHLWEASRKVLGGLAEAYGEFVPVEAGKILTGEAIQKGGRALRCIETPGHAVHHASYLLDDILFAGECAGVYLEVGEGRWYLRPATPPVFKLDPWIESLRRLQACNASLICVGHFGASRSASALLAAARGQLDLWAATVRTFVDLPSEEIVERTLATLLDEDPHFSLFRHLDKDTQGRERYFASNSIQGILGYVRQRHQGPASG
jgi:glyoxylase-like metal-dependent hydrolase (beta-lactamase superfamily II)